jgi:quercetin dioxygenase-like cupin family protein
VLTSQNEEVVAIRLPRTYDPALLQRDLEAVEGVQRASQPGPYHAGEWTGIALHSMGGRQSVFPGAPGLEKYHDTEIVKHTPYFKKVLDELECPKEVARLLYLPPGGHIKEHYDFHTNFQYGLIRLHIPIVTHPDVHFSIGGQRVQWKEGELWYGDFSMNHWVKNESSITRVHMVMDVQINDFVLSLFPEDYIERRKAEGISLTRGAMSATETDLRRFLCDFQVPGEFMPLFTIGKEMMTLMKGARAGIRLIDGTLQVLLDNEPAFALERVGENTFGLVGVPAGVTLEILEMDRKIQEVRLNLKGLPKDLYFARLGRKRGSAVSDRSISLPLLGAEVAA